MQWLCIDIGNTRIKYSFWNRATDMLLSSGTVPELEMLKALISSEVEFTSVFDVKGEKNKFDAWPTPVTYFDSTWKLPFNNLYKTPETLGPDRIAAVAGASFLFPNKNCLAIDMGTCLKFEFIDQNNSYYGGSISPGLAMRYKALNHFTGKLPLIESEDYSEIYGQSSKTAIQCGVFQGILLEIEGRIEQFSNKFGELTVILSGGDADFLGKHLKTPIFAVPLLIQHGIYSCAKLNY